MTEPFRPYDDGIYKVSRELVSTPRRFYPIANTTARIRRDPLWIAIGLLTFAALATITYGDLLFAHELALIWGVTGLSAFVGVSTAILHIDAFGHENALLFSSSRKINRLYRAIRDARTGYSSETFQGVEMEMNQDERQL